MTEHKPVLLDGGPDAGFCTYMYKGRMFIQEEGRKGWGCYLANSRRHIGTTVEDAVAWLDKFGETA